MLGVYVFVGLRVTGNFVVGNFCLSARIVDENFPLIFPKVTPAREDVSFFLG